MDGREGWTGPVAQININPLQVLADQKFENLGRIRTQVQFWNLQLVQKVTIFVKFVAKPILEVLLKEIPNFRTETVFKEIQWRAELEEIDLPISDCLLS